MLPAVLVERLALVVLLRLPADRAAEPRGSAEMSISMVAMQTPVTIMAALLPSMVVLRTERATVETRDFGAARLRLLAVARARRGFRVALVIRMSEALLPFKAAAGVPELALVVLRISLVVAVGPVAARAATSISPPVLDS